MKVRLKYGMEGYGVYWYCLEKIVSNIDSHNLTFELEHDAEIMAHETNIHVDIINEMMSFMIDLGLFEGSGGTITCLKIAKRLDQSMTSNQTLRAKIKHIHEVMPDRIFNQSHDGVMTQSCLSHDSVMQEEIRRDKKRRDKKKFKPPTIEEVRNHAIEKHLTIDPEDFIDFYESKGWMVGKNKMQNWKSAASRWGRKNSTRNDSAAGVVGGGV